MAEGTTLLVDTGPFPRRRRSGQCTSSGVGIGTNLPANVGKCSDGALFHIITHGVRTMPHTAIACTRRISWKIILYLRKIAEGQP